MRPESGTVPDLLEALKRLEAEVWSDPSPRNVMGLADAYRLAGRPERAAEVLAPLLAEDTAAIAPRVLLAWCLDAAGRGQEAASARDTVRALDPANPFGRAPGPSSPAGTPDSASRPAADGTRSGESEAEPERALTPEELARVPPGPLYSATLAEIFERQGFEEKALQIYEQVVRAHPERVDLSARIATLRDRRGLGPS
jgi:predicted Zn-dependent protease